MSGQANLCLRNNGKRPIRVPQPIVAPRSPSSSTLTPPPTRNRVESLSESIPATSGQKRGRGMNKGDPLVTDDAAKIEIYVDFENGCFVDSERILRTIGVHVKLELEGPYANWTMAPEEQQKRYWKAFKSTYRWSEEIDGIVYDLWLKAIAASMIRTFSRMHAAWESFAEIPEWMCEEIWSGFLEYWNTSGFIKRSRAGQQNRAKGPKSTHTTGSVGKVTFEKRLAKATGRTVIPQDQLYLATRVHREKKSLLVDTNAPLKWANDTCKQDYDKYVEHCEEQYGEDRSTWPSFDPEGWLKATGPPKKGKIRGIYSLSDPEVHNIRIPRRNKYFRGESSHSAEMQSAYEAREREYAKERKRMEEKINYLEEQVKPQYMQEVFDRMFAESLVRIREEEKKKQQKQHEAFQNYLGDCVVDTSAIAQFNYHLDEEGNRDDERNA